MLFIDNNYAKLKSEEFKMSDRIKNRSRFSTTLDKETVKILKEYSDKTMIPSSKIIDVAVLEYIKNHPVKK